MAKCDSSNWFEVFSNYYYRTFVYKINFHTQSPIACALDEDIYVLLCMCHPSLNANVKISRQRQMTILFVICCKIRLSFNPPHVPNVLINLSISIHATVSSRYLQRYYRHARNPNAKGRSSVLLSKRKKIKIQEV